MMIIGILNVTPNSFYDGGQFMDATSALSQARELAAEGADIIEIGGESTGPGSQPIPDDEELRRVMPVITAIHQALPQMPLAVDTYKSAVARAAIDAGATMINDVSAGRGDPKMFETLAQSDASLVLMYSKDATPHTSVHELQYDDVVHTVKSFLNERTSAAIAAGIPHERLIIDTGLGHFVSSDPTYSFQLLARLGEFAELGFPILLSPSRKSFLAGAEKLKTEERLPGTIAASAIAVLHGATYIRTHDVAEIRRGCEIAASITPPAQ